MDLVIFYTKKGLKQNGNENIYRFEVMDQLVTTIVCADTIEKPINQSENSRIVGEN